MCFFFLSECALLLLAHNAPVKIKNAQGWSPLAEAISYGDRQMSKLRLLRIAVCNHIFGCVYSHLSDMPVIVHHQYLNVQAECRLSDGFRDL